MKKWSADDIKQLRWRLGWSQAELARKLGCRQQTVSEWETGIYEPQNAYSKLLQMLTGHVENYSDQLAAGSMAEVVMKQVGYTQINSEEIKLVAEFDPAID